MSSRFQKVYAARSLLAATLLMASSAIWAGIPPPVIEYGPGPVSTAVPTLGEWTMVLLALLVSVVAYRALRGRVNGRLLSNLALAGGALAATVAGHGLIGKAEAIVETPTELNLMSAGGGSVNAPYWSRLINTSSVPLQIKVITPGYWMTAPLPEGALPRCNVGTVLQPNGKCDTRFTYAAPT
ncbi:MAG: midcut-by-XrtH protein [Comamonadaceae bacterium]|nr:midcut-by-XrtH protein [Comamonadaceae bacterium]